MPLPLSIPRFISSLAFLGLPAFAAEISGAGGQAGALKPPERVAEPVYSKASDEPLKQAAKFVLAPGFTAAVWASEPMLGNPVSISIDEQGRIFVAETFRYRTSVLDIRHYMFMLEDDLASRTTDDRIAYTKKNFPNDWPKLEIETERVRLVQDTDGDGKADTASVYADGMKTLLDGINSGVLALNGSVWCTNIPNLWRFSGLTKDGRAEKRESLSFGYGVRYSFTGHDMHGLAMGPDGRLYFSFGDRGAYVKTKEGKTLAFSDEGGVFRCEPDGSHLEAVYRGLRNPQELAFDNHGNLFTGDNDCDQGDRERWVYIVEGGDSGWRVGWQHPPLGVPHNMWMTEHLWEPRKAGTPYYITSPILNIPDGPSGVAHYPGTGLPTQFADAFFVCGFKGSSARSAISWWKVRESGAGFVTDKSPAPFVDHVQSTDVEFGPDSRMYFTEWGEGWEGTGRGRIFRLENAEVRKAQAAQIAEVQALIGGELLKKSSAELAALLGHKDQRVRLRAQWALIDRKDGGERFLEAAKSGAGLARLHGIWGMGHLARLAENDELENKRTVSVAALAAYDHRNPSGGLQAWPTGMSILEPLRRLLNDSDAEVRAQVLKVIGDAAAVQAESRLGNFGQFFFELAKALQDPAPRVRFFAAIALSRMHNDVVTPLIAQMIRNNNDQDEFVRHAGAFAMAANATPAQLNEFAKDASRSVRLAALLAYRRQEKAEVAQFLGDADPALVLEAARAINDAGIASVYPELTRLIAKPVKDEHLMLRVLNANFRAGADENAQALAAYAADGAQPEFLRMEALALLGLWAKPPARDRVAGVFRPLKERDGAPAAAALKANLPGLFVAKPSTVVVAAVETVEALGMKAAGPALLALMAPDQAPVRVRAQVLKTLAAFDDPKLAEAIKLALADEDASLRVAASAMLGKLDPEAAARQLGAAFSGAAVAEKKQIIVALGDLKGAAADQALAALFDNPAKIPDEAKLELLEAAEKRKSDAVKAKLGAYQSAIPVGDPVAKFSFALVGGDAENGERLFKEHVVAQCTRCHKVQGSGGDAGPDLSNVAGKKDRRYILESIVNPNAQIAEGFQTVMVTLANGDIKAGIVKAETAETVTLQMPVPDAPTETVKKADIKTRENAPSGMPPGLGEMLSKRDLRDIVEYVAGLRE